jgi:uncharacterized protein (TIGR00369 family)
MKFESKNPDFVNTIQQKLSGQHFMHHIGFELTTIEAGFVEGKAKMEKFLQQQNGFLHGGATATFCDLVAGFAAFTLVEPGATVVTVELKVSYMNPGIGDIIYASGRVIKSGNMLSFCEAEVYSLVDNKPHLIAKCTTTMAKITLP